MCKCKLLSLCVRTYMHVCMELEFPFSCLSWQKRWEGMKRLKHGHGTTEEGERFQRFEKVRAAPHGAPKLSALALNENELMCKLGDECKHSKYAGAY